MGSASMFANLSMFLLSLLLKMKRRGNPNWPAIKFLSISGNAYEEKMAKEVMRIKLLIISVVVSAKFSSIRVIDMQTTETFFLESILGQSRRAL